MKVELEVLGLSAMQHGNGAFTLILREADGERQIPIIIGQAEAAAIGYELEGMKPSRPMTHDLLKAVIDALNGQLTEVLIHDLRDGTFFASLIIEGASSEIDARPSDAIALAIRYNAPIYIMESLIDEAGFERDEYDDENKEKPIKAQHAKDVVAGAKPEGESASSTTVSGLLDKLQQAISIENYEQAAKLRDQIEKLRNNEKS